MKKFCTFANIATIFCIFLFFTGCSSKDNSIPLTIFTVSNDISLGQQIDQRQNIYDLLYCRESQCKINYRQKVPLWPGGIEPITEFVPQLNS